MLLTVVTCPDVRVEEELSEVELSPEWPFGSWYDGRAMELSPIVKEVVVVSESSSCETVFVAITIITVITASLCSRNFPNVKLRNDFVDIWSFYRHSDFMWNPILVNSNGLKMPFLAISETLNFEFLVNLWPVSCSN